MKIEKIKNRENREKLKIVKIEKIKNRENRETVKIQESLKSKIVKIKLNQKS